MNNIDFQTPEWVCKIMVKQMPSDIQTVLEPTAGKGNIISAIKNRYPNINVVAPDNFFTMDKQLFDCIIGNPPFTPMKTGYDILSVCFNMSDNLIFLMPWLSLINSQKRTRTYIEQGLKQIIHLPRNAFKGSRVQTCILIFQKGHCGDIVFKDVSDSVSK